MFADHDENYVRELLKVCYTEIEKLKEKYGDDIIYLDAMKSPIKRIQDKYRYQIMMRFKLDKADEIEEDVFNIVDKSSKTSVFLKSIHKIYLKRSIIMAIRKVVKIGESSLRKKSNQ